MMERLVSSWQLKGFVAEIENWRSWTSNQQQSAKKYIPKKRI